MEKVLQEFARVLKSIHTNSFHRMNTKSKVEYPYLTYTTTVSDNGRNQDMYILDIDIFGRGSSALNVVKLEEKLKDALEYRRDLTPDLNLIYSFGSSMEIPTLVPDLHRRNITFNVKIDERNKRYGIS